ncbi:MAG: DUF2631 domain-containing protein [Tomitella sp.]|nr:DUF2631 domain-containing protein [Tomitella sp.]
MATQQQVHPSLEKAIEESNVDPADEPSVGWGWHGQATNTFRIAGWFFAAFLLLLMVGNHEGWTANIYLIVAAAIVIFFLLSDLYKRHNRWHR